MSKIKAQALEMKQQLVEIRSRLHRCPEPGLSEFETIKIISAELEKLGIEYQQLPGQTSIVGIIRGAHPGKTIGLRADMDALPIHELNDVPYKSQNEGWMHACGHDAHVTVLLGTAKLLSGMKDQLNGNVKLFFQAAEETVGGADTMVKLGCMKNPDVDAVFGLHVHPALPAGQMETRYGALNGSSDTLHITVRGQSSHGAYAELGVDAIVAAAQLITALQTVSSRNISALDSVVLSIGKIQGGTAENIICDEVKLLGTLRTLNPETRKKAKSRIAALVEGVCAAYGAKGELQIDEGYCALINHKEQVDLVLDTARTLLGEENTHIKEQPSLGVEDFSYFLDAAPGAFYHLGCANFEQGITSALHTPTFNIDENCLPLGVAMQATLVLRSLGQEDLAK